MTTIIMTQTRMFSDDGHGVTQGVEGQEYEVGENTARSLFAKGYAIKAKEKDDA